MSETEGRDEAHPRACPICGRAAVARYRPFCSVRCADIDLGRWLNERYRIPAGAETEDEEDPLPGASNAEEEA